MSHHMHFRLCTHLIRRCVCNAEAKLRPVLTELAYNLESFNPAFTAVLLKVLVRNFCLQALHSRAGSRRSLCATSGRVIMTTDILPLQACTTSPAPQIDSLTFCLA